MSANKELLNSDLYSYDYFLQDDVCRLCLGRDAHCEIIPKTSQNLSIFKNEFMDKLRDCLDLDFTDDTYPNKVCNECYKKVQEFHEFKCFCRDTNKKLYEIFYKHRDKETNTLYFELKIEKADSDLEISDDVQNEQTDKFPDTIDESINVNDHQTQTVANELLVERKPKIPSDRKPCKRTKRVTKNENYCYPCKLHCKTKKSYSLHNSQFHELSNDVQNEPKDKFLDTKEESVNASDHQSQTIVKEVVVGKKRRLPSDRKPCKRRKRGTRYENFCYPCKLNCETEESYSLHNNQFHGIEENGTKFKCFGCEKRFSNSKRRSAHERLFCKELKDGYKCTKCNKYIPTRKMYECHINSHSKNKEDLLPEIIYECRKCHTQFKTQQRLSDHKSKEHPEDKKKYVCETCGRVFRRADYLRKHKIMHSGDRPHACSFCSFRTTQRTTLTMHMRRHTGERPYTCDLCPQRCVSSSNLRAHRRTHLELDKHFECNICSKKFSYKISLIEHISSCHDRSQSFACEQCGATYNRQRGLRRHLAAKHGMVA